MTHEKRLPHYGDNWPEVARQLGDLRYDALADFLKELSKKMELDAQADADRARPKLARRLFATAEHVRLAGEQIEKAWTICEPYMGADAGAAEALTKAAR